MTFNKSNFHILDSTVPARVKAIEDSIDIEKTLFIVASKSGSTLEPNCFKQYFFDRLSEKVGKENAGRQFVAITDPGSKMEQIAEDDGFRYIFYGKPEMNVPIASIRVAADVPADQRSRFEVMRTDSATYQAVLDAQRNRGGPWTKVAAGHLDLCAAPIPVREQ